MDRQNCEDITDSGKNHRGIAPIQGTVGQAANVYWQDSLGATGTIRGSQELNVRALLQKSMSGREESRGGAIPFPQKNNLPRRVQISFQDFRQKMFEHQSKNTANFHFL